MAEGGLTLEYTPTWVVAIVCSFIVIISLAAERFLHYAGKYLKKKDQKPLFEALQKIKEELMLLGFISLLLTVFQDRISKICIPASLADKWLPCSKDSEPKSTTSHFQTFFSSYLPRGTVRHLLADASSSSSESVDAAAAYCNAKGKVPLLSVTALHHLHIFIFVLAVVHVVFCVLTILFGSAKIRQWKHWEESATKKDYDPGQVLKKKFIHVQEDEFIKNRFMGIGKDLALLGWIHSFFKQFYGSVTKTDYIAMRLGFIKTHCPGNPKFNFHKYLMRALEADFKKVVGISWYLWVFVVIFLLLNVHGWHAYFCLAFVPFALLLAVGTKLEHVITQLAHEVAEKHAAVEEQVVVKPDDDHFWFHRPQIVLLLIHILLFQNSFELACFFWIWVQYGFDSCIMGQLGFIIPRLVIGAFVQFVCSYSTLPLYAIVTQMGSSFKSSIFEEHVQEGLLGWAKTARTHATVMHATTGSSQLGHKENSVSASTVQLARVGDPETAAEEGRGEIKPESFSARRK
ncbi:hypothetical protein SLE2022_073020 [Rubroshorea leprosula]